MRLFEAMLALSNLLAFFLWAAPLPGSIRWMRHATPAALLIAATQVLAEGPRWQMVPAYGLAGLFALLWLRSTIIEAGGSATRQQTNRLLAEAAIGLGGMGLAISVALPMLLPVFAFPQPGGPNAIGTVTYHWVDASRREVFSTDVNVRRELMVQVWYPASRGSSLPHAPYVQDAGALWAALARLHNWPEFIFGHLKYVITNAIPSAPVSDADPDYPVLIFLEGLTGYRQMSTFQVEELVSHGYIVLGIDQPGAAALVDFPDGHQIAGLSKTQMDPLTQQSVSPADMVPLLNGHAFRNGIIPYFAQDISFALDRLASLNSDDPNHILTRRLDLHRIGVFGVSFGGIVGADACLKESRLKACLIMDVVMTADVVAQGFQQPGMWITRDADTMRLERETAGGWTEKDIEQTQTTMRAVYDRLPADGYFLQVPGMFHVNLTDIPYFSPLFSWLGITGPIDGQRAHDIINAYSLAFFDRHLKAQSADLLDGPTRQFPEVSFESRLP